MNVKKQAEASVSGAPTEQELQAINAMSKGSLTAEQVYVFAMRLCDDQVDRDYERFDTADLGTLAKLFVGKTGIVDHHWSAQSQVARIFRTEVQTQQGVSFIKAWAYIRRGGQNDELIADIEAGIKKEVSVGCAMARAVCSVCGQEIGQCGHVKGEHYDGQLCCGILRDPIDAYEFSFVAVPAQSGAGVIKAMGGANRCLKELAEEFGAGAEYRSLYQSAQLGKQYENKLRDKAVRLMLVLELDVKEPTLRSMVSKASPEELMHLIAALEEKTEGLLPAERQLRPVKPEEAALGGYLI